MTNRHHLTLLVALALLMAGFTGCAEEDHPLGCDCPDACAPGHECIPGTCLCNPNRSCTQNADCEIWEECLQELCLDRSCRSDSDCPPRTYCDWTACPRCESAWCVLGVRPDAESEADADADTEAEAEAEYDDCSDPALCSNRGCGAICQSDDDCPDGLQCLTYVGMETGTCTAQCDPTSDDCGCYWHCGKVDVHGQSPLNRCLPGGEECLTSTDCGDPRQFKCTMTVEDRDGDGKRETAVGRCIERDPAADCGVVGVSCTHSGDCCDDWCMGSEQGGIFQGTCIGACRDDADCPQGYLCEEFEISLGDDTVTVKYCLEDIPSCERDQDCEVGKVCGVRMSLTPECIDPACERGTAGCGTSGEVCTDQAITCYNNACLGSIEHGFHCCQFCREGHTEDCEVAGQRCLGLNTTGGMIYVCVTQTEDADAETESDAEADADAEAEQ